MPQKIMAFDIYKRGAKMAQYENDSKVTELKKFKTGYYLYYKINGKRRMMKLCSLSIPVEVARTYARKNLILIDDGIDPMEEKQSQGIIRYRDIHTSYVQDCRRRKVKTAMPKGTNKDKPSQIEDFYTQYIEKSFGNKLIQDIKRADVKKLHADISEQINPMTGEGKIYQANRILQQIKATYNNAISEDKTEINPATHVKMNTEQERDVYLTPEQLNAVVHELNLREQNTLFPNSIKFIWLSILTGARKGELAKACWSDLHINKIILNEHKTDKDGKPRTIYLSTQALSIINSLPRNNKTIIGLKDPSKMWRNIRTKLGIEHVRIHDLRHSFGSYANKSLGRIKETGNLLGHKDMKSTQRYVHIFQEDSLENAQVVGDFIQKQYMTG